eukprot:CAMPEP_0115543428 /NCGR_PEP_ID=MMETSP0271-20121206/91548_1 /TAXON_ID=71861 /ORGANISM="Scrippsiella trochoidea, Strain CCMP3099" /LENGTH=62 /DNA_ID=CAMNT_0002976673 /DNA_START=53 /DNA_END=237 /DNA_ORIENTATION=+
MTRCFSESVPLPRGDDRCWMNAGDVRGVSEPVLWLIARLAAWSAVRKLPCDRDRCGNASPIS